MESSALQDLLPLLKCPACGQAEGGYEQSANSLSCKHCNTTFQLTGTDNEIPWLFRNPQASWQEWKSRYAGFVHLGQQEQKRLRAAQKDKRLGRSAQRRLKKTLQARESHATAVSELLAPLDFQADDATIKLSSKVPKNQGLLSYHANIFRDWAWDNGENEASLQALEAVMDDVTPGKMLTLGAGSCRLPYDLHRKYEPELSVALDFNPLLLFAGQRAIRGLPLRLQEFPPAPIDAESFSLARDCSAPAPLHDGFQFLLADAMDPPFAPGSFDTVLTPWLIDIIPQNLREYALRINQLLVTGGVWLNFGSLAFFHTDETWNYSQEDVLELLENNGFELLKTERRLLPYLQSPASGNHRVENVFCFSARKRRDAAPPPVWQYLPDWLTDEGKPVPRMEEWVFISSDHLLQAQVLGAANGQLSMEQIAALVAKQYGLGLPESLAAVRRIFLDTHETTLRNSPP